MVGRRFAQLVTVAALFSLVPLSCYYAYRPSEICTDFLVAAANGDLGRVNYLLKTYPDLLKGWNLDRALKPAAESGRDAIVSRLLDQGANIDTRAQLKRTPLMAAAAEGHYSTVRLLLKRGAATELRDRDGNSALDLAMGGGNRPLILLLKRRR